MLMIAISVALVVAGVIHVLPLSGALGPKALERLYGVPITDSNTLVLLQHRAVLFGLLGVGLLIAAFTPAWQAVASVAGLISALSFLVIALCVGGYNAALQRVVKADVVAIVCLGFAAWGVSLQ